MSFNIKTTINGTPKNLSEIQNVRAVKTVEIEIEDYLPPTEVVTSGALTYTTQNGQSSTAAPRNGQNEWKFVRGNSSSHTATSAAATGSFSTAFNSNLTNCYFFANAALSWGRVDGGNSRFKFFVSKGSDTDFDNNLSAMASATYKGVGEKVFLMYGYITNALDVNNNTTVTNQVGSALIGHFHGDGVVSHTGYWELNISLNGVHGAANQMQTGTNGSTNGPAPNQFNPNSNARNMLCRFDLANASTPTHTPSAQGTEYHNQPQGNTYIVVTKKDTYYRPEPNPLSQTLFESQMPTITLDYPDGYGQNDVDVIYEMGNSGQVPAFIISFGFGDYNDDFRESAMYAALSQIDLKITKNANNVTIELPDLYGSGGIYPAPQVTAGTGSTYHRTSSQYTYVAGQSSWVDWSLVGNSFNILGGGVATIQDPPTIIYNGVTFNYSFFTIAVNQTWRGGDFGGCRDGVVGEVYPVKATVYFIAQS